MAKPVTTWSNNDVKPTDNWAVVTKNVAQWMNDITKSVVTVALVTRNSTQWGILEQAAQTYLYDDSNIPYDSSLFEYNYIVDNNTLNWRNQTTWVGSEK